MTIHMRSIPYRLAFFIAFTFSTLFSCGPYGSSWEDHAGWVRFHYDKQEYMVPMRDGVELFTIVYTPNNKKEALPILLYRTPYSIAPYGSDEFRDVLGPSPEFDRDGYIFAFQDVRGKFKSEGEFAVIRPLAPKPKGATDVDESTDNFDTIEWLLANEAITGASDNGGSPTPVGRHSWAWSMRIRRSPLRPAGFALRYVHRRRLAP